MLNRVGSCTLCGDCCGGGNGEQYGPPFRGAENLNNGDPLNNPWFIRLIPSAWQDAAENNGSFNIDGDLVRYIWVEGVGLCTDLPPVGKPPYDRTCPMLGPNPGDGTRPCRMYGNPTVHPGIGISYEEIWNTY